MKIIICCLILILMHLTGCGSSYHISLLEQSEIEFRDFSKNVENRRIKYTNNDLFNPDTNWCYIGDKYCVIKRDGLNNEYSKEFYGESDIYNTILEGSAKIYIYRKRVIKNNNGLLNCWVGFDFGNKGFYLKPYTVDINNKGIYSLQEFGNNNLQKEYWRTWHYGYTFNSDFFDYDIIKKYLKRPFPESIEEFILNNIILLNENH